MPRKIARPAVIPGICALGLFFAAQAARADATGGSREPVPIDACALLQRSEIARSIGAPVGEPARHDAGLESNGSYSSSCVWEIRAANPRPASPDAPLGGKSFVILNAVQWPAGSGRAHLFLDSFRQAAENGDIPGKVSPRSAGDDALWWGDGLAVRRYDVSFGLSVFFPLSRLNRTGLLEERLAPLILRRIDARQTKLTPQGSTK
ncbi:MAG TPA: hypothetical protein VIY54_10605 [Steroidobacteraceae bacterium]